MNKTEDIKSLLDKVKAVEKGEKLDLSSDEDLSIAVMNLISIEEHLFFSGGKTGDSKYYDLLFQVREMRKTLLKKIIKNYEGEEWCISKHLLAGCMRLMEVGTKSLTKGDKKEAEEFFQMAYSLYSLFWGINLKLLKTEELTSVAQNSNAQNSKYDIPSFAEATAGKHNSKEDASKGFMAKLGQVIKTAIDCCRE